MLSRARPEEHRGGAREQGAPPGRLSLRETSGGGRSADGKVCGDGVSSDPWAQRRSSVPKQELHCQ